MRIYLCYGKIYFMYISNQDISVCMLYIMLIKILKKYNVR